MEALVFFIKLLVFCSQVLKHNIVVIKRCGLSGAMVWHDLLLFLKFEGQLAKIIVNLGKSIDLGRLCEQLAFKPVIPTDLLC